MTELTQDLSLAQARSLINSYAFDLGSENADRLLQYWLDLYHASWIRLATIEALYLGRYKAISIEHILNVWLRIGSPNPHFSYEFERLICRKLPKHLSDLSDLSVSASPTTSANSFQPNRHKLTEPVAATERIEAKPAVSISQSDVSKPKKVFPSNALAKEPERVSSTAANLGLSHQPQWSKLSSESKTIHQFTPLPDVSSFFDRLKTFGQEK
ncbi:hypothetical protein IQ255_19280 [Pleurocapsales cyanobacterium LEGE 10410]|nr:hypothetical protein [Pleurocapsales cyanobacterium LEGE 10410]